MNGGLTKNPESARPSAEALAVFFRSLAVLFESSVHVSRALELLGRQSDDRRMAAVAADLAARIHSGVSMSQAMALHPMTFTGIQLRLMQIGERTGSVDGILARLAGYEETRRRTTMRVKSALTYPAFLFVMATTMLILVPPFLFEGIFRMIANSGIEPPLITQIVVGISNFIRGPIFWVLLGVGMAVLVIFGPRLVRQPGVEMWLCTTALRIPALGRSLRMLAVSRFARAMELQLEVGETPLRSLELAAQASGNPVLTDRIERAVDGLRDGLTLTQALDRTEFFPRPFIHMLTASEESARTVSMMRRMAEVYESEVEAALDTFTALLEPLVMLVMGVIVGVVVVATMLPMMHLLQNL
ncbi:MAG: type II secretion system F family protein [Armatimonadetes bacterium]|nr:type II secretion system F family protein [Armatimonadota bacterium]